MIFPPAIGARSGLVGIVAWAAAILAFSAATSGQPAGSVLSRPTGAGRVVQLFDFEEQAFNAESVPRYWVCAQDDPPFRDRPGFPKWNLASFDYTVANSGNASVRLPTSGGSTSLRLSPRRLPVFAESDLMVSAMVRTSGLEHSAAFLAARFVDQMGNPVEGAEVRSPPVHSPDKWTQVSVQLPAGAAGAAFVQIELLLLQPEQRNIPSLLGTFRVFPQDLSGAAWFDDVGVYQVPRLQITPADRRGVFAIPQAPELNVLVRDLAGENLSCRLVVRDVDDAAVATSDRPLPPGGAQFVYAPALPRLGWYEATVEIRGVDDAVISRARTSFIWAPGQRAGWMLGPGRPPPDRTETHRLSLLVDHVDQRHVASLANMIGSSMAGTVSLPAGALLGKPNPETTAPLRSLMDRVLAADAALWLSLPRLPTEIADEFRLEASDPLALMDQKESAWIVRAQGLLDLYGQRASGWRIGPLALGDASLPPDAPALGRRMQAWHSVVGKLVTELRVGLPWRADWEAEALPSLQPRPFETILLTVPHWLPVEAAAKAASAWAARAAAQGTHLDVIIDAPPAEEFGHRTPVIDTLRKAVQLWQSLEGTLDGGLKNLPGLALVAPWDQPADVTLPPMPRAELCVWSAVAEHLSGRRIVGQLPAAAGVTALILADQSADRPSIRPRGGALVAWAEGAEPAQAVVRGYLGSGEVTVHDVFGNVTRATPVDGSGLYQIELTPTPVFIEGIDHELARFVAAFSVTPSFVPSVAAIHEHRVVLSNPWPVRISGTVQLVSDETNGRRPWTFAPVTPIPFSISPGQSEQLPFSFSFSSSEEAGLRRLNAIVRLSAGRQYPPLRLMAPIMIGLNDIDMSLSLTVWPGLEGSDVVVAATVNNMGSTPRTLQIEAVAVDTAQQRQSISSLGPGESTVRRFVFKDGGRLLSGKRIRVSLSDVDHAERLNKFAVVP